MKIGQGVNQDSRLIVVSSGGSMLSRRLGRPIVNSLFSRLIV